MLKSNSALLTIAVFLLAFGGSLIYFNNNSEKQNTAEIEGLSDPNTEQVAGELVPESEFRETGWIPYWGSSDGLRSLRANGERFASISPVWYEVNGDGTLVDKRPANYQSIIEEADNQGIELIPSIALFDHELLTEVLQSPDNLDTHIEEITAAVLDNDYDGIDFDYESTKLSDKQQFFYLLENVYKRLQQRNKAVSVTVLAQWGQEEYTSLPETRQVQDWQEISKYADEIRIMTYDYTSFKAMNPGPIAPIDWQEQVLKYAIEEKQVPREKLYLGIHLYSYEWWMDADEYDQKTSQDPSRDPLQFQTSLMINPPINDTAARSYTYSTVRSLIDNFEGDLSEYQSEQIFKYRKENPKTAVMEERVLVFIDPQGVADRINLAKQYGIKGVAYWRLGNEGDLL
jgi:spore germination protein